MFSSSFRIYLFVAATIIPLPAVAQPLATTTEQQDEDSGRDAWLLSDRDYYNPLIAEPHAARIRIIFPAWASEFPHSVNKGRRFAWQVAMGREIPIVGWDASSAGGLPSPGRFSFGIWIPVSFHVVEDFKDVSNPIVDTDYRFGFMLKGQYGLSDRNVLGLRFVPWQHESTHLGDEYTILAQRDPSFERVNVSYEHFEYGVSLEHAWGTNGRLTLRHGGLAPWGDDGYYSDHLLGEEARTLSPSTKNFEPSFGFELRLPSVLQDPASVLPGPQWFGSIDVRHKLAYVYHQLGPEDERRHLSWSLAIGRSRPLEGATVLREVYVYAYRGVNPYGQLRSQFNHTAIGLGFNFR